MKLLIKIFLVTLLYGNKSTSLAISGLPDRLAGGVRVVDVCRAGLHVGWLHRHFKRASTFSSMESNLVTMLDRSCEINNKNNKYLC